MKREKLAKNEDNRHKTEEERTQEGGTRYGKNNAKKVFKSKKVRNRYKKLRKALNKKLEKVGEKRKETKLK